MCVLSTWFGDICGSRKDFCMFYKRSRSLISNSIRCGCLRTDQCNIACSKAAVNINALAIGRRPPARRRRTVPCDLRRASLPVPPLFLYCFLILCVQRSGPRFPVLVDIRLATVNRHARCSLYIKLSLMYFAYNSANTQCVTTLTTGVMCTKHLPHSCL